MCRLYGFRASEPTKVECTLVRAQNALVSQSRSDAAGRSHGDGWGIGYYRDGEGRVERRVAAAFEDLHFSVTAERVHSRTVVAHVRKATKGRNALENTHPFQHGRWMFAHNGTLTAFERLHPRLERDCDSDLLLARRGQTDSELIFYWLLSRMRREGMAPAEPHVELPRLVDLVRGATRELDALNAAAGAEQPAQLNFILTDGAALVASRWRHPLNWVARQGIHDCEICGIPHIQHDESVDYRAVVVASEPISHEPWRELPDGGVLSVDGALRHAVHAG